MVLSGWRAAALLVIAVAVLALLVALAVWVAAAVALVGSLVWLNVVLLPRLSRGLHVHGLVLALVCLPLLCGLGWFVGRTTGAGLGTLAWLAGIGLPRVAAWRLRDRMRAVAQRPGRVIVVESPALAEPAGRGSNSGPGRLF